MALSHDEFLKVQAEDEKKYGPAETDEVCGCGCGQPLDTHPDDPPKMMGGRAVRDDCWYEQFSQEIDDHPIGGARGLRRPLT